MTDQLLLSEELSVGPARIRVDVAGTHPPEHVLDDTGFLDYRLGGVVVDRAAVLDLPDIVWEQTGETDIGYDGRTVRLRGEWGAGPLQKLIVAVLALRLEQHSLHPFHAAAVRYRDRTVLFLGGESNHGKSMCQIEACRRGAALVSTETTVIDDAGRAVRGSKELFIKRRVAGTERADKAAPEQGVRKFFGDLPSWQVYDEPSDVDVVVVPAIDGNYETSRVELTPFERQFQALHSVQNYLLLNELLAPGWPMPILDTEERRRARARFLERFCQRPFHLIRAATPQALLDEAEAII